ncbi:hypothetical protein AMATHDRAFT_48389 [Amanita thiersii Skay4041]|uniref:Uncharacterized protein n=1 Tax=Amanita thiersii Skay4041 TaxID=703135 RepID=A0A2A9NFS1_9AGAR|nr:hypothetical protein AMATHDRAFT_48389 [Amanita thiersii Skay4041]
MQTGLSSNFANRMQFPLKKATPVTEPSTASGDSFDDSNSLLDLTASLKRVFDALEQRLLLQIYEPAIQKCLPEMHKETKNTVARMEIRQISSNSRTRLTEMNVISTLNLVKAQLDNIEKALDLGPGSKSFSRPVRNVSYSGIGGPSLNPLGTQTFSSTPYMARSNGSFFSTISAKRQLRVFFNRRYVRDLSEQLHRVKFNAPFRQNCSQYSSYTN